MDFHATDILSMQNMLSGGGSHVPADVPDKAKQYKENAEAWQEVADYGSAAQSYERALQALPHTSGSLRSYAAGMAVQRALCMDKSHLQRGLEAACTEALELGCDPSQSGQLHGIRGRARESKGQFNDAVSDYMAAGDEGAASRARILCAASGQVMRESQDDSSPVGPEPRTVTHGSKDDSVAQCNSEHSSKELAGERVQLTGLKKPSMNGQFGFCGKFDPETGRYAVTLETSCQTIAVKPNNLKVAAAAEPCSESVNSRVVIQTLNVIDPDDAVPPHSVTEEGGAIVVTSQLMGVSSVSEIDLECTTDRLSLVVEARYELQIDLPHPVDFSSIQARFDKGTSTMIVRAPRLHTD